MSDEGGFSTTEIRDATGKTWDEWSRIIDAAVGREQTHSAVVAYLNEERGVQRDWAELVAVRYARERELDADDGPGRGSPYQVRIVRTIAAARERVFAAWTAGDAWSRWFTSGATLLAEPGGRYETAAGDAGAFLVVDPPHRLRFTWENPRRGPGTVVDVTLAPTADGGTHLELAHEGLSSAAQRDDLQAVWSGALDRLRAYLEGDAAPRADGSQPSRSR